MCLDAHDQGSGPVIILMNFVGRLDSTGMNVTARVALSAEKRLQCIGPIALFSLAPLNEVISPVSAFSAHLSGYGEAACAELCDKAISRSIASAVPRCSWPGARWPEGLIWANPTTLSSPWSSPASQGAWQCRIQLPAPSLLLIF